MQLKCLARVFEDKAVNVTSVQFLLSQQQHQQQE